ncbi:MAG: helicase-associated domain-containing protein, partial [Cellulomonadaceae bacterium]
ERQERIERLVARLRADDEAAPETSARPLAHAATHGASEAPRQPTSAAVGTRDPAAALTRLREAIDAGTDVWLDIVDGAGRRDHRRVRPLRLDAGRLRARDVVRESELTVAVHRIVNAEPAS